MMPGLDGLDLVAALHADPATAEVPVLLLPARAGPESAAWTAWLTAPATTWPSRFPPRSYWPASGSMCGSQTCAVIMSGGGQQ